MKSNRSSELIIGNVANNKPPQSSSPIQLEVGKGGDGDKLTMNIDQCNSGYIYFDATFSVPEPTCSNNPCTATRSIRKTWTLPTN